MFEKLEQFSRKLGGYEDKWDISVKINGIIILFLVREKYCSIWLKYSFSFLTNVTTTTPEMKYLI